MKTTELSLLALFVVLALGLGLGKIKVRGISLEYAGVILVGVVFGAFGVLIPEIFQTLGLVFFVFSVGMQSGPSFLPTLQSQGLKMLVPAAGMILLSLGLALGLGAYFHLDPSLVLGLFTGSRSSNSALTVGVQVTGSPLPALGHSLAYPLAVLGILFFMRLLPRVFRVHFATEEALYRKRQQELHPPLITKTFIAQNPVFLGRPLEELHLSHFLDANISRIMHQGLIHLPGKGMVLSPGDLVKVVGPEKELSRLPELLGPETQDDVFYDIPFDLQHEAQWFQVNHKDMVNKPIQRLGFPDKFGATVTRLKRNGFEITPHGSTVLRYGDLVLVVAGKTIMPRIKDFFGERRRALDKDFLPFFFIVLGGLALGSWELALGPELKLSLGLNGGVLLLSLALSAIGKTGPFLWAVSDSSLGFIRHLGLLLFLGAVGSRSGSQILPLLQGEGPILVFLVFIISLVPLLVMALVCRFLMKMDFGTLMGLLAGATTCSPALGVTQNLTPSEAPTIAYATVFPFALLFMMICAQVMASLI